MRSSVLTLLQFRRSVRVDLILPVTSKSLPSSSSSGDSKIGGIDGGEVRRSKGDRVENMRSCGSRGACCDCGEPMLSMWLTDAGESW